MHEIQDPQSQLPEAPKVAAREMAAVPLEFLRASCPLPFSIWGSEGSLLLAAGQSLSIQQLEGLKARDPRAYKDEIQMWQMTLQRHLAASLRAAGSVDPMAIVASHPLIERLVSEMILKNDRSVPPPIQTSDVVTAWDTVRVRASIVLHNGSPDNSPLARLETVIVAISRLLDMDPDASLFLLVRAAVSSPAHYSIQHALLTAAISYLVAKQLRFSPKEIDLALRSGLTMNISMTALQDELALQEFPPTPEQRKRILDHPQDSARLLEEMGVDDPDWLSTVALHHASANGAGYPDTASDDELTPVIQVVHHADQFAARISPRRNRSALDSMVAARRTFIGHDGAPDVIGSAIIKQIGMYPPGTFVRLDSKETAIVVRRGQMAHSPVVAVIANAYGTPNRTPTLLQTAHDTPGIKVVEPLLAQSIRILISEKRILSLR